MTTRQHCQQDAFTSFRMHHKQQSQQNKQSSSFTLSLDTNTSQQLDANGFFMVSKDRVPVRLADSVLSDAGTQESEALVFTTPDGYIYFQLLSGDLPIYRFDFEVRIKSVLIGHLRMYGRQELLQLG
jgi:hypothetical protein